MPLRIVLAQVGSTFLEKRVGPRLKRDLSQICKTETGIPYAGEIRPAVGRAWCRSDRGFLVAQAAGSRRRTLGSKAGRDKHDGQNSEEKFTWPHRLPMTRRTPCVRRL